MLHFIFFFFDSFKNHLKTPIVGHNVTETQFQRHMPFTIESDHTIPIAAFDCCPKNSKCQTMI